MLLLLFLHHAPGSDYFKDYGLEQMRKTMKHTHIICYIFTQGFY